MKRLLIPLFFVCLLLPSAALAEDNLAALESAIQAPDTVQPGLQSYRAVVQTERIASTIASMTAGMPADMARPQPPTVVKYWRRGTARSLIAAEGAQASPFMQQMVERVSASLAIDPEELLMPPGKAAERQRLVGAGTVRSTVTDLADSVLQRVEIRFPVPTDIGDSFYGSGLRLPQKGISRLQFDIEVKNRAVRELTIETGAGELLLAEFRYRQTTGGQLPEKMRVTSPDGKVDDRLEITFIEAGGYLLPAKVVRILNRPGLQDNLEVTFSDYRVNQPFPAEIEAQLAVAGKPGAKTP